MAANRTYLGLALLTLLAACGGGGDSASSPPKDNLGHFEATAVNDNYVTFEWELPETDVAPTPGTHFFFSALNGARATPAGGPQENLQSVINLAPTLPLPDLTKFDVTRVLKAGAIHARNGTHRQVWAYAGTDVTMTSYAADGSTPLYADVADDWSAPVVLTGAIGNTAILRSFLGFTRLATPQNLDFTTSWLPGSTYFTRKGYRQADTLFVYDWTTTTFDAQVSPYPGPETTIEAYFAAFSLTLDSRDFVLSDGVVSTVQGARTWVSSTKRPTSAFPTDNYPALIELNGKLYFGGLQKANTRFRFIDGVDRTVVNDYVIRLNRTAADSIAQATRF